MELIRSHWKVLVAIGVLIGFVLLAWFFWPSAVVVVPDTKQPEPEELTIKSAVIGQSVAGRVIEAYSYGVGDTNLLFVGGVHGGYEWNSVLLAYEMMDYLEANPAVIPENLTVTIIPSANPDGLYEVVKKEGKVTGSDIPADTGMVGSGRLNQNGVDLNRNFDCKWQPSATWRGQAVSAGETPFSEPEAITIRDFVLENNPEAVIFWHSQANAVYASECKEGILPVTLDIMSAYAVASGYTPVKSFDSYPVTGDAEGWLASIGIPALTVELSTHTTLDWQKNLAGVRAIFDYFK